jgi:hypothetical protein
VGGVARHLGLQTERGRVKCNQHHSAPVLHQNTLLAHLLRAVWHRKRVVSCCGMSGTRESKALTENRAAYRRPWGCRRSCPPKSADSTFSHPSLPASACNTIKHVKVIHYAATRQATSPTSSTRQRPSPTDNSIAHTFHRPSHPLSWEGLARLNCYSHRRATHCKLTPG